MRSLLACSWLTLAGCSIVAPAPEPMGVYDLGAATAKPAAAPIGVDIHVTAAAELRTRDMLYRSSADSARLSSYAENRWAAPPALLLERQLLLLMPEERAPGANAQVEIQLLVFEQRFDQGRSEAVLVALATLAAPPRECARTRFDVSVPAATADAPGGAQAFAVAAGRLADELGAWIAANAECRPTPPAADRPAS